MVISFEAQTVQQKLESKSQTPSWEIIPERSEKIKERFGYYRLRELEKTVWSYQQDIFF